MLVLTFVEVLAKMGQLIEPPVDVDRNEWMALLERGSGLAQDIEKMLPTFIAYTQGPNPHLVQIMSKVTHPRIASPEFFNEFIWN